MRQEIPEVLYDELTRRVFTRVAENRKVAFRQLKEEFKSDPAKLREALERLVGADLIGKSPASIEELEVFFVTAEGLSTGRRVKRG